MSMPPIGTAFFSQSSSLCIDSSPPFHYYLKENMINGDGVFNILLSSKYVDVVIICFQEDSDKALMKHKSKETQGKV